MVMHTWSGKAGLPPTAMTILSAVSNVWRERKGGEKGKGGERKREREGGERGREEREGREEGKREGEGKK